MTEPPSETPPTSTGTIHDDMHVIDFPNHPNPREFVIDRLFAFFRHRVGSDWPYWDQGNVPFILEAIEVEHFMWELSGKDMAVYTVVDDINARMLAACQMRQDELNKPS